MHVFEVGGDVAQLLECQPWVREPGVDPSTTHTPVLAYLCCPSTPGVKAAGVILLCSVSFMPALGTRNSVSEKWKEKYSTRSLLKDYKPLQRHSQCQDSHHQYPSCDMSSGTASLVIELLYTAVQYFIKSFIIVCLVFIACLYLNKTIKDIIDLLRYTQHSMTFSFDLKIHLRNFHSH